MNIISINFPFLYNDSYPAEAQSVCDTQWRFKHLLIVDMLQFYLQLFVYCVHFAELTELTPKVLATSLWDGQNGGRNGNKLAMAKATMTTTTSFDNEDDECVNKLIFVLWVEGCHMKEHETWIRHARVWQTDCLSSFAKNQPQSLESYSNTTSPTV